MVFLFLLLHMGELLWTQQIIARHIAVKTYSRSDADSLKIETPRFNIVWFRDGVQERTKAINAWNLMIIMVIYYDANAVNPNFLQFKIRSILFAFSIITLLTSGNKKVMPNITKCNYVWTKRGARTATHCSSQYKNVIGHAFYSLSWREPLIFRYLFLELTMTCY